MADLPRRQFFFGIAFALYSARKGECNFRMQTEIERLRAELAELREREDKYKQLMETTDTGFVILDEAGRVLDANLA
jgi:PAS domain-containing protein